MVEMKGAPMRTRLRLRRTIVAIATVVPLAAAISLVIGNALWPRPTVEEVCALAQAGRIEEAEVRGDAYLRLTPDDPRALLVTAELALARPVPDPEKALGRLERIRPDSPALAAWVQIDRGNALYLLSRYNRSEACWNEALRLDPSASEAVRRLIDLYTFQGRSAEARVLALRQCDRVRDSRERVRLLLRLARLEVDPPEPWSVVKRFEGVVQRGAADLPTVIACGRALAYLSRGPEAERILRGAMERDPDDPSAWDGLMTILEISHQDPELVETFARLPPAMSADPRFAKHRGWVEQQAGRWAEAARDYRRAWEFEPDNIVGYRLRCALRFTGQTAEAERTDRIVLDYREAFKQVRAALGEAKTEGEDDDMRPIEFCARMAGLRERMGRADEARAWRQVAMRGGSANRRMSPDSGRASPPVSPIGPSEP
jgi:tetratricopeptide (TPR) repeat protein